MAVTKKAKDKSAKKEVDELLEGISLDSGKKKSPTKTTAKKAETAKNVGWLEKEVERLTTTNSEWENKFIEADTNYKKAYAEIQTIKGKGNMDDTEMKAQIVAHFKDLEDALLGRNPERTQYKDTTVIAQLDKFVGRFPFLKEIVTKH